MKDNNSILVDAVRCICDDIREDWIYGFIFIAFMKSLVLTLVALLMILMVIGLIATAFSNFTVFIVVISIFIGIPSILLWAIVRKPNNEDED